MLFLWPVLLAVLVCILHIDWVVIPLLHKWGYSGLRLFYIAAVLSTIELKFWYWFWGWVYLSIMRSHKISESIEFGKKIEHELEEKGYILRVKEYFIKKFDGATDEKSKIVRFLKWGGGFSLFLIGASPESGSRVVGIICCKTTRWHRGFYILALGNLVHIAYIVGGWNLFFWFFK